MAYDGTIDLISGIRQKNGGTFPLVDASAVRVDDNNRLTDVLDKKADGLSRSGKTLSLTSGGAVISGSQAELPEDHMYALSYNSGTGGLSLLEDGDPTTGGTVAITPYGSPLKASAVSAMTDTDKVYVYTGSETGYTAGHWYYHNGTAWTDGGVYNSVAFVTDTTLEVPGAAADAKVAGDMVKDTKNYLGISYPSKNIMNYSGLTAGYLKTDGTIGTQSADHEWTSDYIPIKTGKVYKFVSTTPNKSAWIGVCYYTSAKAQTSNRKVATANDSATLENVTIPNASTAYMRVSWRGYDNEKNLAMYDVTNEDESLNVILSRLNDLAETGIKTYHKEDYRIGVPSSGGQVILYSTNTLTPKSAILFQKGDTLKVQSNTLKVGVYTYELTGGNATAVRAYALTETEYSYTATHDCLLFVLLQKSDGSTITMSDYDLTFSITVASSAAMSLIAALTTNLGSLDAAAIQLRTYDSTDLDDYIYPGYTILAYSGVYTHMPNVNTGYRAVIDFTVSNVIYQFWINITHKEIFARVKAGSGGGTWGGWVNMFADSVNELAMQVRTYETTDLDDYVNPGYTILTYSGTYSNAPSANTGYRIVFAHKSSNVIYQFWYNLSHKEFYARVKAGPSGGTWQNWQSMFPEIPESSGVYNESKNTTIYNPAYTQSSLEADIPSEDKVRVMSYNVAHFDNDSAVHIGDVGKESTLIRFKQMLMTVGADIVCTQEDDAHIDSNDSLSPLSCIFAPLYPYKLGEGGPAIYYRKSGTIKNYSLTDPNITVRRAIVTVGTKSLYVYTAHLAVSSHDTRLAQLSNIMTNAIGDDDPEYWVLCGDFNTGAAQDESDPSASEQCAALQSFASTNNCTLANGGYLGWIETNKVKLPLDNFLCSQKVVISKFDVLENWYPDLWSDHYPVYADLILLD